MAASAAPYPAHRISLIMKLVAGQAITPVRRSRAVQGQAQAGLRPEALWAIAASLSPQRRCGRAMGDQSAARAAAWQAWTETGLRLRRCMAKQKAPDDAGALSLLRREEISTSQRPDRSS